MKILHKFIILLKLLRYHYACNRAHRKQTNVDKSVQRIEFNFTVLITFCFKRESDYNTLIIDALYHKHTLYEYFYLPTEKFFMVTNIQYRYNIHIWFTLNIRLLKVNKCVVFKDLHFSLTHTLSLSLNLFMCYV